MTNAQKQSKHLPAEAAAIQLVKPSTSRPLNQSSGIERLFDKLSGFYGSKFGDLWRGCDLESVKRTWVEALAGYSRDEIQRGLDACLRRVFPPTLPEFLMACRQPVDLETAYYEACDQIARRAFGEDSWTHPAIFWAAMEIGEFALRNSSWPTIKTRWAAALQKQLDKGAWPDIPKARPQLPSPDSSALPPGVVLDRLAKIKEVLKSKIV